MTNYSELIGSLVLASLEHDVESIEDVEENCGTIWITCKDGTVYAVSAMETIPDENEETNE